MKLRDLTAGSDPKAGSGEGSTSSNAAMDFPLRYGDGANFWRGTSMSLVGLVVGMTVAWITAMSQKGMSEKDMQEYVKDHAPWVYDRERVNSQLSRLEVTDGALQSKIDKIADRMAAQEFDMKVNDKWNDTMQPRIEALEKTVYDRDKK